MNTSYNFKQYFYHIVCRNIEEILAERGEEVKKLSTDDGNVEVILRTMNEEIDGENKTWSHTNLKSKLNLESHHKKTALLPLKKKYSKGRKCFIYR